MTPTYDADNNNGLDALDGAWQSTKAADMDNLPDGIYTVTVLKCYMGTTRDTGKPTLRWEFSVLLPMHLRNRRLFRTSVISQEGLPYLKRDLAMLGINLARISDLPFHCQEALAKCLEVKVRTKDDRQNVYFNKLVANEPSGIADAAPGEMPF